MKRTRYEVIIPMPINAAHSSPAQVPRVGKEGKYCDEKYVYEAK
jgi:hypothetical protein